MKRKVQTCYFTRFLLLLGLFLYGPGYDSSAQSSFSAPVIVPDSVLATPPAPAGESVEKEIISFPADSLYPDRITYHIPDITADTNDSSQAEIIVIIGGAEGWRMMAAPTHRLTYSELLNSVWTQGLPDSDDPISTVSSILVWNEADGGFTQKPSAMTDYIGAGRGFIAYLFEDDEPAEQGVQGGFPKELILEKKQEYDSVPVTVTVTATDENGNNRLDYHEGWNLISNPFDEALSVKKVISAFQARGDSLNQHVYVWSREKGNGNAGFKSLGEEEKIAPFQAFFIKYMGVAEVEATVELRKAELLKREGLPDYHHTAGTEFSMALQVSNGEIEDEYELNFSEEGTIVQNRLDALKLFSMKRASLNIYGRKGQSPIYSNHLPAELPSPIEIPVGLETQTADELTISWKNLKNLPHEWTVTLIDRERDIATDLRTNREYRFLPERESDRQVVPSRVERPQVIRKRGENSLGDERFILSIKPGAGKLAARENPESIKLKPNYPNPFNQETIISYELNEETEVTLSIWNMIGQRVATLVDDQVEAGTHEERWSASQMPSGMYIARLEVGNQVFTRKMTLIK